MSFSQQSKFALLRDQRKVANRAAHGAQGDADQPVGRPEFLPPHAQSVQQTYEPSSRAPSAFGDVELDIRSVGYESVVSNKTREDSGNIVWDENVQRYRDLGSGVFVKKEEAVQLPRLSAGIHQDGAGVGSLKENESAMQT